MKREDLRKIENLSEDAINQIMNLHQADVSNWNDRFSTQQNAIVERDNKINEMSSKLSTFDGVDVKKLQKEYNDLQHKYEYDMLAKDRDFATSKLFDSFEWTSSLAKNGALAEFNAKGFEFKDGKFANTEEFFEDLKKTNPEAFKSTKSVGTTGFSQEGSPLDDGLTGVERYFYDLNPNLKK